VQALNFNLQNLNAGLELQVEARTAELQKVNQQQALLFQVVAKIRQSLDLETIFKITTTEVRQILGADRVGIYQFDLNSQYNDGVMIAEDVLPQFTSALTVQVHDHCFGDRYAHLYLQGRIHAVSDIHQAELEDCFRAVLEQFEIQATLVAPIMRGQDLWGLFCVHQCATTRNWQDSEVQFIRQVSSQVSIALEQANLLTCTQNQAREIAAVLAELKNTQVKLIHQEKMSSLGRLVAGIAHEINNPVNFVHGNLIHVNDYMEEMIAVMRDYQSELQSPSASLQAKLDEFDWDFVSVDLPNLFHLSKIC
jgi:GAF domain-containing protein